MDVRQLRYFIRIAQLLSFSRAANTLGVAQPALSRQISALEEDLNLKLFIRTGRGVNLTTSGSELLSRATKLIDDFDTLQADMRKRGDVCELDGEVRIGLPAQISHILSAPILKQADLVYPRVTLRIIESYSALLLDGLKSGAFDLVLLYGPPNDAAVASRFLAHEDLCLIGLTSLLAEFDQEITADRLSDYTLIVPHHPHPLRNILQDAQIRPARLLEAVNLSAMRWMVETGAGLLVQSPLSMLDGLQSGKFCALSIKPTLQQTVFLCHLANRPLNGAREVTASLISDVALNLIASRKWPVDARSVHTA